MFYFISLLKRETMPRTLETHETTSLRYPVGVVHAPVHCDALLPLYTFDDNHFVLEKQRSISIFDLKFFPVRRLWSVRYNTSCCILKLKDNRRLSVILYPARIRVDCLTPLNPYTESISVFAIDYKAIPTKWKTTTAVHDYESSFMAMILVNIQWLAILIRKHSM